MNRYDQVFKSLKEKDEMAFIAFASAGDPDISTSEAILKTYIDAGADILEIGYPFSDPVADGPINQRAAQRAIAAGLNHACFFKMVRRIRDYSQVPMGVLMYANSAFHLGYDTFCKRAADAGIDSILIADMPPEESHKMLNTMDKNGLRSVFIVTELTPPDRMRFICDSVSGFVYVVSRLGTTGVQTDMDANVKHTLSKLKKVTAKPLCVGFGISTPGHVEKVKKAGADGAIVGSALVDIIEKNLPDKKTMLAKIARSVRAFKKATLSFDNNTIQYYSRTKCDL
jgi:tryptophan synthase alpha chain